QSLRSKGVPKFVECLQQSSAAACYPYDPSGLATCASYPDR
ncbi:hypothetical protein TNIN_436231, partial [Trichonephila inaurata madagascariensis]